MMITSTLSTRPILHGQKATSFLHRNQIFDVIVEKSDYDIKNLIVIHKARGLLAL